MTIRLFASPDQIQIPREDVYFTFGSGRLSYDCVTCGATCCRGFGYQVATGPLLASHLSRRPALPLFVAAATTPGTRQQTIANSPPGCFFLADNGYCEIHVRDGYEAKPETCRLFPFNNFRRLGKYLIVRPHPFLCPLRVDAAPASHADSDHEALFAGMASQGITADVTTCAAGALSPDDFVRAERAVVALADAWSARGDIVGFLEEQATDRRANGEPILGRSVQDVTRDVCELLGVPEPDLRGADPDLARTLVGMTPFLRSRFLLADAATDPDCPHSALSMSRVPFAMLFIYIVAATARETGMKRITFQTISRLEQDFRSTIRLLAFMDEPLEWIAGAQIDPCVLPDAEGQTAYLRIVKELLAKRGTGLAPLGAVLRRHLPRDPMARVMFLKALSKELMGKVAPRGVEPRIALGGGRTLWRGMQRWMVANADEQAVLATYRRIPRTQPSAERPAIARG